VGRDRAHGPPEVENYGLVIQTSGVASRVQVELCAPCHSRRTELGDYNHTRTAFLDNLVPVVLEEGLYYPDGQILDEVYEYGSFVQSKMFQNNVRCSDCHDVHRLTLLKEGNDLCLQCHRKDAYDSPEHHFHQMTFQGKPNEGARCVKCHMPERPYMIIDYRADHSLRVPRPDLTVKIGTPNACGQSGCHDDKPVTWIVDAYDRWYGKAKKPHYGTALAAGRAGKPEAQTELVRLAGDRSIRLSSGLRLSRSSGRILVKKAPRRLTARSPTTKRSCATPPPTMSTPSSRNNWPNGSPHFSSIPSGRSACRRQPS